MVKVFWRVKMCCTNEIILGMAQAHSEIKYINDKIYTIQSKAKRFVWFFYGTESSFKINHSETFYMLKQEILLVIKL